MTEHEQSDVEVDVPQVPAPSGGVSKLTRYVVYCFAVINTVVVSVGILLLLMSLVVWGTGFAPDIDAGEKGQYTNAFICLYVLINAAFLFYLIQSTIQLFKLEFRGLLLLASALKLELAYVCTVACLGMFLPAPFGTSVVGAFGVGNIALAPQLIILYPITGLIALWAARKFYLLPTESEIIKKSALVGYGKK